MTSTPLTPRDARLLFPGLSDKMFLNAAAVSLLPAPAADAASEVIRLVSLMPGPAPKHHLELDSRRRQAAVAVASLLGARSDEVALVESTTHGLNIAALALPLRKGDGVLIPDTEYIQLGVTWLTLAKELGLRVTFVKNRQGRFRIEDFDAARDRRTRVICLSSVQWATGVRADLKALSQLCRDRGIYLVVDAIQHAGAVRLNVRETPVDIIACGGHKWMNAPLGCGFLYIRRSRLAELRPPVYGHLALKEPRQGWDVYWRTPTISPNRVYRFPRSAKTFETGGTANYAGAVALRACIDLLNAVGADRAEAHSQELVDRFLAGLDRFGMTVVSPRERTGRAGIVCFQAYPDPERNWTLVQKLLERRIYLSLRYTAGVGGIRVSLHYFNTEEDVDRLLETLQDLTSDR